MHICLVEDDRFPQLYPLTYLRPVFDLRCGILTLREKVRSCFPSDPLSLVIRPVLAPLVSEENPGLDVASRALIAGDTLLLNGRVVLNRKAARMMRKEPGGAAFVAGGEVVAVRVPAGEAERSVVSPFTDASLLKGLKQVDIDVTVISYPWDLIYSAGDEIEHDLVQLKGKKGGAKQAGKLHKTVVQVGRKRIHIGKKTTIGPGVVLDASKGPIVIGQNVTILANAVIYGPAAIGDGSVVKAATRIYPHTVIGPVCKVAGEIEHSVFQGYANKAHDGYVGHSFVSSWVNLGAGTTTSNLKNTYGTVRATINGQSVDSGRMFLGLTAGDHVKTGINTTLDTGTVIGVGANLFGTALPPKYVPSFSWGSGSDLVPFRLDKAIAIASTVMQRRSVDPTDTYRTLMKEVYKATIHERAGDTTTV